MVKISKKTARFLLSKPGDVFKLKYQEDYPKSVCLRHGIILRHTDSKEINSRIVYNCGYTNGNS